MKNIKTEYIYAGISIFLWATISTVTKLLLESINTMQLLLLSSLFAFAFLFIVNCFKKNLGKFKEYSFKDFINMSFIGLFGVFFYNFFIFLATDRLLAQEAFIVNYLWPIMTVVFACIILKEKITGRKALALILSFFGVVIVLTKCSFANMQLASSSGVIFAVLAAVCYGLFCVLNKKNHYDELFSMMIFYITSIVLCSVYMFISKDLPVMRPSYLLGAGWIGIFTSAIPLTLWAMALRKGNTAKISNLAFITPFLSLIYIYFILHEPISIYSVIGLVVIVAGIFVQMNEKKAAPHVSCLKCEKIR